MAKTGKYQGTQMSLLDEWENDSLSVKGTGVFCKRTL